MTFRFCYKEEIQKEGKAFTFIFYPAAILVSALFLLLTLIAYVIDPDLHKPLFGKITLGFVCNNLIAYLCLAFVYLGANYRYHDVNTERFIDLFDIIMLQINTQSQLLFLRCCRLPHPLLIISLHVLDQCHGCKHLL